jgi:CBS domain-containing membrane protein
VSCLLKSIGDEIAPLRHVTPGIVKKLRRASYVGIGCLLSMGSLAGVAAVTQTPFIFPSLGPTAYLLYFAPQAPASTPRACMLGHAIALVCGYAALTVSGLVDRPPDANIQVELARVISAGLALGLTSFVLILVGVDHPPAGATTLIVALGLITHPWQLVVMELAAGVLLLQAIVLNALTGLPVPRWKGFPPNSSRRRNER